MDHCVHGHPPSEMSFADVAAAGKMRTVAVVILGHYVQHYYGYADGRAEGAVDQDDFVAWHSDANHWEIADH